MRKAMLLMAMMLADQMSPAAEPQRLRVYVGTYTRAKNTSAGIYHAELTLATGALRLVGLAAKAEDPSFLAIAPDRQHLFCCNELSQFDGKASGAISSFQIDAKTGVLTLLNQQLSGGAVPCHLVTDPAGKHVLFANYTGGSVGCMPVGADGKLGPCSAFVQHHGSSVNPARQTAPHAHSINLDPTGKFAIAADLGLDQLLVYRYDAGRLTPHDPPFTKIEPGSGPRHFAFHPSGKFGYVINEIGNTVTALIYDGAGKLEPMQTISTLPADYKETSHTSEVAVHPTGKFLYGSNRGHNSLAVFAIDPTTGKLTAVEHASILGKNPRNFTIEPSGRWLLCGNQDTDEIVVFQIHPATGKLTPTGAKIAVPKPVCIRFLPID